VIGQFYGLKSRCCTGWRT